ncbi:MAG: homocysteine S-methyltransferase family protein [Chloroflexi bacterium]|nr:homocysteine S-methyltransferase family protein [Chloroflexota bacterium]
MNRSKQKSPTILDRLARGETLISDGATGTYLQQHGLEPGGCPEEFNATHPEVVRGMAKAYFDAGSDMVLTNSFGGTRFRLKHYGYQDRVRELNRLAAQHARSQAPPGHYVFGSVGPTGEFLEPLGQISEAEMYDAFVEQITALEEGGADGVVIETMTAIEEATLAIRAAKENTRLVVMSTMFFDKGPRGFFTMMGVTPERAVKELREAGADVVGANCGVGIDVMLDLARQIREATDSYILVHSNAGIPSMKGGEIIYPETPDYMAERFKKLADMGINIIGGCCGTGPAHIRALSKALRG